MVRPYPFVLAALVALAAGAAHAGAGVNIRWDACLGDGGVLNKTFACNSNAGTRVIVTSFVVPATLTDFVGEVLFIDAATASAALPNWWQYFNAGTCRQSSLGANFLVSATAVACVDWSDGTKIGGIASYTVGTVGPNTATIHTINAVPSASYGTLSAGPEYFSTNLTMNSLKTVGVGACTGCSIPACIALRQMLLYQNTPAGVTNTVTLTNPTNGTDSNVIVWQGGAGASLPNAVCPQVVPTRRSSWNIVKQLYR
jgi:hypothetical protein